MFASDIRYIIKKIIIGVGIALTLIFLKGNLLMDVHAQASAIGQAGQVYSSCQNCHELHVNLGSSWANWDNGDLTFNGAIFNYSYGYSGNGQERFTQIIANSYVVANDIPYACSFDSMNNPTMFYSNSEGELSTYQTTGFSIRCKNVSPGAKGIQSINLQGLGLNDTGIGIRIYSPITFSTDTQQSQTSQITTNNNQNTDREIANQNANTEKEIESQKVCKDYGKSAIKTSNKKLNNSGVLIDSSAFGITDYIKIDSTSTLKVLRDLQGDTSSFCFYNTNKTLISCVGNSTLNVGDSITIPSNSSYVRFSINFNSDRPNFNICKNGNQAMSDSVNDVNDTLNDDNVDGASSEGASFFDDFSTIDHGGLSGIITAPLRLINALSSGSCSPLEFPLPFVNEDVTINCVKPMYSNYFGTFFTLYQLITTGLIAYWVCIKLFSWVRRLERPDDDKVEVLEL